MKETEKLGMDGHPGHPGVAVERVVGRLRRTAPE